jgi:hypothetical protein
MSVFLHLLTIVVMWTVGRFYGVKRPFQQYFSYIVAASFIEGNRSTRRKPELPQVTNKLYHLMLNLWICMMKKYCVTGFISVKTREEDQIVTHTVLNNICCRTFAIMIFIFSSMFFHVTIELHICIQIHRFKCFRARRSIIVIITISLFLQAPQILNVNIFKRTDKKTSLTGIL